MSQLFLVSRKIVIFILLFFQSVNEFSYKYVDIDLYERKENELIKNEIKTISNKESLQNKSLTLNADEMPYFFSSYSVTIQPCGDLHDYLERNPLFQYSSFYENYSTLLELMRNSTSRLNDVNFYMKSEKLINVIQEKILGKHGYSIHYLTNIKGLYFEKSQYASFNDLYYRTKYSSKHPTNFTNKKCDTLVINAYDSRNRFLVRKIINKNELSIYDLQNYFKQPHIFKNKSQQTNMEKMNINKDNATLPAHSNKLNNRDQELKFIYNFDIHKLADINLMYKKYSMNEDSIKQYAIIQDKLTRNIYMHIKTFSNKHYLNSLQSISSLDNKFMFSFKKTNSLTIRMKSIELWNIIRYEQSVPDSICDHKTVVKKDQKRPLASSLLNCDNFDEDEFYDELKNRGI
jgi:hypothetical protein